jgi:UDP-GlcNAc:undecaprenyl-phosphate GlcNAc-1-phosphate transferase
MGLYWVSAVIGCLIALLVTPLIRPLALRIGGMDRPNHRTIHHAPTPRLGGVAIFASLVMATLALYVASPELRGVLVGAPVKSLAFFAGLTVVFALGVFDDLRGLDAWKKFPVQILAATIVYVAGFRADAVGVPWGGVVTLGVLSYPVTVIWIVGLTNAINLIDGLDGLAAGISAIASATICVIALHLGNWPVAVVTAVLAGVLIGFLRYNFHPAKLFMGDSGSLVLGFFLATVALQGVQKGSTAVVLLVPIVVMAVPIADTLTAIVRRLMNGLGPFTADREHFHHRLIWKGLNQTRAVLCLYAVSAVCGLAAYVMAVGTPGASWAAVLTVIVGGVLLIRELEYAEFAGILGRIVRGDRRRRPPRYKNLVLKQARARIETAGSFDRVWRSMTMAAKELEFDMLCLKPSGVHSEVSVPTPWRSRTRMEGQPFRDTVLWTQEYPLPASEDGWSLTVGKYLWKVHRRNEDEERWGRELAEAFGRWLSANRTNVVPVLPRYSTVDTEILPPLVVSSGSVAERSQTSPTL